MRVSPDAPAGTYELVLVGPGCKSIVVVEVQDTLPVVTSFKAAVANLSIFGHQALVAQAVAARGEPVSDVLLEVEVLPKYSHRLHPVMSPPVHSPVHDHTIWNGRVLADLRGSRVRRVPSELVFGGS